MSLSLAAIAVVLLPDGAFAVVTTRPWEIVILKMLGLIGVSLLAVLPWASQAGADVRRRLRLWSIPGVAASTLYLVSTDPVHLLVGFCLLTGATLDTWMSRTHVASETFRARLPRRDEQRG
jgi:hypothetical protein